MRVVVLLSLTMSAAQLTAEVYRIDSRSQWEEWAFPAGLLRFDSGGSLTTVRFRGETNVAPESPRYTHEGIGGVTHTGGVWKVGSGAATASRVIDGDAGTFWQPDPTDPLEDWWLEVNLGRSIPVTRIKLVFPDEEGARPLRQFRVFGSSGERRSPVAELFAFELVGGTTRFNESREVEFRVPAIADDTTIVVGAAGADTAGQRPTEYRMLQFVRVRADMKSPEASLAEVEVYTIGDNVALGTAERGGTVVEETGRGTVMADGDYNSSWSLQSSRAEKIRWEWDLGALFWLDRLILVGAPPSSSFRRILDHEFLVSDGSRTLTGALDFDLLADFETGPEHGTGAQEIQYLFARPRPVRFMSAVFDGPPGDIVEVPVYAVGHPALVEMTSGFIDLGAAAGDRRPKQVEQIVWDADLPAGTQVQVRTRSGNELAERTIYFHRDGSEITREKWETLNSFLRGDPVNFIDVGADWSSWSSLYQFTGQGFLSPSPRRFLQMKIILSSDRPEATPTLHAVGIEFEEAFVAGATGRVEPRTAGPGEPVSFTYTLQPDFRSGDPGFDRIRVRTPSRPDADSLRVTVAGQVVEPQAVVLGRDSILVDLPGTVRRDTVELRLHTRLWDNPTLFAAAVGRRARPGLWQSVDADGQLATSVFFPAVPGVEDLLQNLSVEPGVVTPNGDGTNDDLRLRFAVINVANDPRVWIYDLRGHRVRSLEGQVAADGFHEFRWDGMDASGARVPPGTYLAQVRVETESGPITRVRAVAVAY